MINDTTMLQKASQAIEETLTDLQKKEGDNLFKGFRQERKELPEFTPEQITEIVNQIM